MVKPAARCKDCWQFFWETSSWELGPEGVAAPPSLSLQGWHVIPRSASVSSCFAAPPLTCIVVVSGILWPVCILFLSFLWWCYITCICSCHGTTGAYMHLFMWLWCICIFLVMPFYFHFSDEVILPAWSVCMEMYSMALVGWIHVLQPFFFSFLFFSSSFFLLSHILLFWWLIGGYILQFFPSNFGFASQTKSFA